HGNAHTVAINEPAAFVGDDVADLHRIQAAVNLPGERLQLCPKCLLSDHLPELMVPRIARRELGHSRKELEESPLGIGIAVGVLPNFNKTGDLLIDQNGRDQYHIRRWISGCWFAVFPATGAAMRRDHLGTGHLRAQPKELVMRLPCRLACVETDLADVDLELQLEVSLRRANPDSTGRGGDGGEHSLQELAVIIRRGAIFLGKLGNFFDQTVDLLPGLLEKINVNLRLWTCTHRV